MDIKLSIAVHDLLMHMLTSLSVDEILHKDAAYYFEWILEEALHKTAAVQPLSWMAYEMGGKMN